MIPDHIIGGTCGERTLQASWELDWDISLYTTDS